MQATFPKRKMKSTQKIRKLLLQCLISLLTAILVGLFFHASHSPKIVTVDVSGMIQRFVKTTATTKLPPDQLKKRVDAFGEALDSALKTAAQDQGFILLPKEAVIAGTKDISGEVEIKLNALLHVSNQPSS